MEWSTKNILSINIRWSHGCRGSSACLAVVVVVLGPGVLAPDVQHEHSGNEHQGTHQHWQWTHLDARRVVGVEPPHAACGRCTATGSGGGGLALPDGGASYPTTATRGSRACR